MQEGNSEVTPHMWRKHPSVSLHCSLTQTPALVSCRLVSLVSPLHTHSWASSVRTRSDRRCRQNHTSGSRLHPRSSVGSHFHLHSVRAKHRKTSELQTRVSCKHSYTAVTNTSRWQTAPNVSLYYLCAASVVTRSWGGGVRFPGGARPLSILQNVQTDSQGPPSLQFNEFCRLFPLR